MANPTFNPVPFTAFFQGPWDHRKSELEDNVEILVQLLHFTHQEQCRTSCAHSQSASLSPEVSVLKLVSV